MPVELRKRKAREPIPAPPPRKKAAPKAAVAKVAAKAKEIVEAVKPKGKAAKPAPAVNGSEKPAAAAAEPVAPGAATAKPAKGDTITLEGFGGEVETHDGKKTTLKALVDESKTGVVLFTYPKASTPGCTNQACFFRDSYDPLTAGGLAIYGLSADSPKENIKFKEKQKLPYSLLCDPKATLLHAIGLKKGPGKAIRGVFVVDKAGKVLAAEPGSPAGTLEVVKKIVADAEGATKADEAAKVDEAAPVAAVADAAAPEGDKKEDKA